MAMNAASLKGYRELCGITQQQLADMVGVSLVAIKKWERGERSVPQDVCDFVLSHYAHHCEIVDDLVGRADGAPEGSTVGIEYFRNQQQADVASERESCSYGSKAVSYQELNAAARSAAEILLDSGQLVTFHFPDEEDVQRAAAL